MIRERELFWSNAEAEEENWSCRKAAISPRGRKSGGLKWGTGIG
jgi:hypothetical protein